MAFQSVTSGVYTVHPSANDVASTSGDGSYLKETLITDLLDAIGGQNDWVLSGFDYASASGLTATMNAGTAVIAGYYVSRTGTWDITLADDSTNHVWLTFSVDGSNNVSAWGAEVNTTGTAPTGVPGYIKLATITTVSGSVTGNTDERTTTHPLDEANADNITSGTLIHEIGGLEADVSAYDGLVRIAGGSTSNLKSNFSASAAPSTSDDSGSGYVVGSRWIDTTNDKEYVCLDNTASAAVWTETTGGGGGATRTMSARMLSNGSQFSSSSYAYEAGTSYHSVYDVLSGGSSNWTAGASFLLPSDLTSLDSVHIMIASHSLAPYVATMRVVISAKGDDENTEGGTYGSISSSSWMTSDTGRDWVFWDVSAAIPSSVVADDLLVVTIKNTSSSDIQYVASCRIEYT